MRLAAAFTDHDGTTGLNRVAREGSRVTEMIYLALQRLSSMVLMAVITSKDVSSVRSGTAFARTRACTKGIEARTADGGGDVRRDGAPAVSGPGAVKEGPSDGETGWQLG